MNNQNQRNLEEKLELLASLSPDEQNVAKMNQRLRAQLGGRKESHLTIYSLLSTAAMLLFIFSLWNTQPQSTQPLATSEIPLQTGISRIELNRTFQTGGQQALEQHLDHLCAIRNAQTEPLTLQEIMKEL